MFKDTIEKRIRRNEALPHPEMDLMWAGMWGWLFQLHIPFYIFLAFYQDYFPFLATMDATIVLLTVFFHLTVRQLIQRGVIQAYYRQHYSNGSGMLWSFLLIGSVIRTIMFGLYYGISLCWVSGDATKERWHQYVGDLQSNLSNVAGAVVGVGLCLYLFYSLFYKDRFITVVEYSERVVRFMRQQKIAFNQAAQAVLSQRQRELVSPVGDVNMEGDIGDLFAKFFGEHQAVQTEAREYAPVKVKIWIRKRSRI